MRDPDATRQAVVQAAAVLFNERGYRATSLRDIEVASGLTKGAIYQHFRNKQDLELQAFDYLFAASRGAFTAQVRGATDAPAKLKATWAFYRQYLQQGGVVSGGCPLLNAGTEADDAYPALADRARAMLAMLRESLVRILRRGVQEGQLRADLVHPEADALYIIALLEGGILISRLTQSSADMDMLLAHLNAWLQARLP